jgi:hypothetical protein
MAREARSFIFHLGFAQAGHAKCWPRQLFVWFVWFVDSRAALRI